MAYIRKIGTARATGMLKKVAGDASGQSGRVAYIIKVMNLYARSAR